MGNWIDHLVLAAPSLESGIERVASLTGVAPVFGGKHEGNGTHNALLSLGAPTYLEVLAPDPDQATPSQLLGGGELSEPRLYGFAVGTDDLDAAISSLKTAGVPGVGDAYAMTRRRPDSSLLAWRLAMIGGGMGGARPFLISWDDGGSPADTAPVGGRFMSLRAGDPDPDSTHRTLEVLGLDVPVETAEVSWLEADVETAAGVVTLT